MNAHLQKFLEIYEKFPPNTYYTREERKARHDMLKTWENAPLNDLPTLDELINFTEQYKNKAQIMPQFFEKFKDVWQDELQNGYKFAKFLLETDLAELMQMLDISLLDIANQVLKHDPHHKKALNLKLKILISYHDFCLHEIPFGILTRDPLEEELRSVQEMQHIAQILEFKDDVFDKFVECCKIYYPLWFEFLGQKEKFDKNFEKFLISKGIDTQNLSVPYIAF